MSSVVKLTITLSLETEHPGTVMIYCPEMKCEFPVSRSKIAENLEDLVEEYLERMDVECPLQED